jgi:hypothetical protein
MPTVIELPLGRKANGATIEIPDMNLSARADETRRVVSDSADSLGAAAGDFSREAVKLGRDAIRLGREAARRGLVMATTGEKALRRASNDAAATIEDLRSYEIVRKRRGPDWRPGIALAAGAGVGLAAMYLLDPEHGRRRRVELMDRTHKFMRIASERLDGTVRDLRNRSEGWAIEARRQMDQMRAPDAYLTDGEGVMATPDVSDQLAKTDWPGEPEPAASESHR